MFSVSSVQYPVYSVHCAVFPGKVNIIETDDLGGGDWGVLGSTVLGSTVLGCIVLGCIALGSTVLGCIVQYWAVLGTGEYWARGGSVGALYCTLVHSCSGTR